MHVILSRRSTIIIDIDFGIGETTRLRARARSFRGKSAYGFKFHLIDGSSSSSSSNAKMRWFRTQHTEAPRLLSLSPLRTDADENPEVASPRLLAVSKLRAVVPERTRHRAVRYRTRARLYIRSWINNKVDDLPVPRGRDDSMPFRSRLGSGGSRNSVFLILLFVIYIYI
ncbi:unnamed protein product [Trichogramma brassicae]|uniref:Uncharacterized protein n=1 Tax=Trichogramma brassicae TaxID=86971 RepID=A0A6H5I4A1_9HYME|nr:unnamed protein product [Trichogramma brassicae]